MTPYYHLQEYINENRINDESLVYNSWECQKGNEFNVESKNIKILSIGRRNHVSGPDYKNVMLMINNETFIGDVEMHNTCKEWYEHQHHLDSNYSNVILHVISTGKIFPIFDYNNRKITTVQIASLCNHKIKSCFGLAKSNEDGQLLEIINMYSELKYEQICERFKTANKNYIIERLFHFLDIHGNPSIKLQLTQYFLENKYKHNKHDMILFLENMLNSSNWENGSRFPNANPNIRLPLLVYIGYLLVNEEKNPAEINLHELCVKVKQNGYLTPGNYFVTEINGNIIIPLIDSNSKSSLFNEWIKLKCQPYGKCKRFLSDLGIKTKLTFGFQQGILFLMNELCNSKSCQQCTFTNIN